MLPIFTIGQGTLKYDFGASTTIPAYTIGTIDTSWSWGTTANYSAAIGVVCANLAGTLDGLVKMQGSFDGTTWFDLNMASFTPTATDTVVAFHIPWYIGMDYDKVRLLFDRNSLTGGTLTINARFNRRR